MTGLVCETCGFGQWRYNQNTLTCKNGHHVAAPVAGSPGPPLKLRPLAPPGLPATAGPVSRARFAWHSRQQLRKQKSAARTTRALRRLRERASTPNPS